ncbi:uncharacterized protein LOC112599229 [Melanaphis sacchari]|uniref:uncharacterized protein LOC112599229 n=1 Tax=Melanaphis sacchari TaxID=742174 RepID=UPI000DC1580E|nr:uncharacterized protein LOC112599229 [Melanaphis sacchari]
MLDQINSLVYRVSTDDFYQDLLNNPLLSSRMDRSNLPLNHPCYDNIQKKVPGLFKNETAGRTMTEFIALRAKSYAYKIEGVETLKANGIRGHVVRNHLTFYDHKHCLFENDDEDIVATFHEEVCDDNLNCEGDELKCLARRNAKAVIDTLHRNAASTSTISTTTSLPPPDNLPNTPYRLNINYGNIKIIEKSSCLKLKTMLPT